MFNYPYKIETIQYVLSEKFYTAITEIKILYKKSFTQQNAT